MTFSQWMFGGIDNPFKAGQWGPLHIGVMLGCVALMIAFYFIVKHAKNKERTRRIIINSLGGAVLFFEIMSRFMYCVKKYILHHADMVGLDALWIILPKPWCAIACWALIACIFVKKTWFYNYASLTALLCSVIYFCYPGTGFNNEYLLFDNWYSILTHALLLTMSITLITLKFADFKYKEIWKFGVCLGLTYVYGFIQIFLLHTQTDPMYFMPNGDIQAGILQISYGLYLTLYIVLIVIYVNSFYLIGDRENVKKFFRKLTKKETAAL